MEQKNRLIKTGLKAQKTSPVIGCARSETEVSNIYWLLCVVVPCARLHLWDTERTCFSPQLEPLSCTHLLVPHIISLAEQTPNGDTRLTLDSVVQIIFHVRFHPLLTGPAAGICLMSTCYW